MRAKNPYEVLGVERTASEADIHDAFRKLAKRYHPDLNPGNRVAEELFKEAAAAYAILSQRERRARFDRDGTYEESVERAMSPAPWVWTPPRGSRIYGIPHRWIEYAERVFALRAWAVIGLGLWLLVAITYGTVRGLPSSVDGIVVDNDTVVALDHFVLWGANMSRRAIVWEHTVRRPDGRFQTFMAGPACSRLSSRPLDVGTHVQKDAWQRDYTLNGKVLDADLSVDCAFDVVLWLVIALVLLAIGIVDWVRGQIVADNEP